MIDRFSDSDSDYDGYVSLKRRVWPHEHVTVSTQRTADNRRDPGQFSERLLVREDGEVVGAADVYSLPFSADDQRFGFMVIVDPAFRRRGIGTGLYDSIVNDLDVGPVCGWETAAWEGDPSGSAWLERLGFELVSTHQMSELELDRVDTAAYREVIESVEATGVTLMSLAQYMSSTDDAAQEMYELAIELSRDVPWYEEVAKPSLEVWRREFLDSETILADAFTVAVLNGELIGQSALMRDRHDPSSLATGLTGVRQPFRRRRIATAMKMRAIDLAKTQHGSGVGSRIRTGNAAENPMLDLNLRLGFARQPAWFIYAKAA